MTPDTLKARSICADLIAHLSDGIVCDVLDDGSNRVGCVTPLEYPNGDSVVVWVIERGGTLEVSDYGEGLTTAAFRPARAQKSINELAMHTALSLGVNLYEGRIAAHCGQRSELGENIWRVANASAQVAQSIASSKPAPKKDSEEHEFVRLVADTLHERHVPIEREHKLRGTSGHYHRATIYLSESETVLEPVWGHWNQVASVYTKFSDLSSANGYRRFSLLDDRQEAPGDDVRSLLVSVSDVLTWSSHDSWLNQIL